MLSTGVSFGLFPTVIPNTYCEHGICQVTQFTTGLNKNANNSLLFITIAFNEKHNEKKRWSSEISKIIPSTTKNMSCTVTNYYGNTISLGRNEDLVKSFEQERTAFFVSVSLLCVCVAIFVSKCVKSARWFQKCFNEEGQSLARGSDEQPIYNVV